jgi:hypothetical protein
MRKAGLGFTQHDNAFLELDDPQRAQKLADRFAQLPWVKQLTRWARQVNPLMTGRNWLAGMNYYWVTEQAEYATDVLFASRARLGELYPRLLDHAAVNFSARDILTFLGRKLHGNFQGEVLTDLKKKRCPRCPREAPDERQLAEDVRQIRPAPPRGDGDQPATRIPRASSTPAERAPENGLVPDEQRGGQPAHLPAGGPRRQ